MLCALILKTCFDVNSEVKQRLRIIEARLGLLGMFVVKDGHFGCNQPGSSHQMCLTTPKHYSGRKKVATRLQVVRNR